MDRLYSEIERLEKDLANDRRALDWFDITPAVPPSSSGTPAATELPLPGAEILFNSIFNLKSILQ